LLRATPTGVVLRVAFAADIRDARRRGNPRRRGERAKTASIDGRGTVEYTSTSPAQESTQRWIAADLEFPVKVRMSDGATLTLEHIRVEAQPAALFGLPGGYRKSDTRALIERIKHSVCGSSRRSSASSFRRWVGVSPAMWRESQPPGAKEGRLVAALSRTEPE
jgi:hypothetical protein